MKKKRLFITKHALALFMLLCSLWGWGQATETLACPAGTISNNSMTFNTPNFTIVHSKGNDSNFASYSPWRVYTNNTVTFTEGTNVQEITSIVINTETESYAKAVVNGTITIISGTGSVSASNTGNTVTIQVTGDVKAIRVKPSAQTRWSNITINYISVPTCSTAEYSFASPTLNKTTADAPFTNTFTTNNTSAPVYTSSDTNVATVDAATGEVTIVGMGSATIKVAQDADETYCAVSADYTLNVTSATPSLAISGPADLGESCLNTATTTHTYTITNTGNSAANGLSVSSDNPQFVVSDISSTTVNGTNGTVTFDVTFTPAAAGQQSATLTVESSTSGSNTATYSVTGTGTASATPVVTVGSAEVTDDTATLHGNVTSLGTCLTSPIVNRGFIYTVFSSPEINGGVIVNEGSVATGEYSVNVSGLTPAKTYYYKAFVVDAAGQYYYSSTEGSFTTTLPTPVATEATNVTPVAFTANWNAVSGAEGYKLDVYTLASTPATAITETFSNTGTSSSSYADITWTGDGLIEWTATKSRNDQVITTGNRAITLRDATGSKLESGVIQNGLSNISFDVKQVFSGSGGVLTIKVLTGPAFATVTTIGTHAYSTTASTYNSGVISGITGDYKIVIEHNASARPAIDNLSFTSLPTSTQNFVAGYENLNVGNVTSKEVTGLNPDLTYYYVVRAVSAAVASASSNGIEVTTLGAPTWNGTAWSNTTGPDASTPAIIDGDYAGPAITAQSLTVNAGKTLTVNNYVSVGNVTNHGNILVADGANFVQTGGTFTAGAGSSFIVRKDTKPVKRLAYINWSSPLQNAPQTLKEFSFGKMVDGTSQSATGTVDNRFFTYNNNVFESVAPTSTFSTAAGYLIRTPNDFTSAAQVFHGQFEGSAPNSGTVTFDHSAIGGDFVLLGNPYPSAISLADFLAANPGTLGTVYVWNSQAEMDTNQQYTGTNYNTYSTLGEVPAGSLNGYLPVGQAFFVERGTAASPFVFTDAMRRTTEQGLFSKADADRFWLELTTPAGAKPQLLLGFTTGATAGFDAKYDATLLGTNADALYTRAGSRKLVIDAHGAFSADDSFAIQADLSAAGNYTIGVLKSEGVFAAGQQIWLTDHLTGSVTLISEQPYAFTAQSGSVADRFTLQFRPGTALSTGTAVKTAMTLFSSGSEIHAAADRNITSLEVYDTSGRQLVVAAPAQKETTLQVNFKGVVIVKALLQDGTVQTKKLMLK